MQAHSQKRRGGGEAVILFAAAGHTFAISATAVDEIRTTQEPCPSRVRGKGQSLVHEASGTHYVVDAAEYFQLPAALPRHLLVLRNSGVALAIDAVERMTTVVKLYALPRAFRGDERRWYRGLALIEGRVVPVLNPENILTQADVAGVALVGAARE